VLQDLEHARTLDLGPRGNWLDRHTRDRCSGCEDAPGTLSFTTRTGRPFIQETLDSTLAKERCLSQAICRELSSRDLALSRWPERRSCALRYSSESGSRFSRRLEFYRGEVSESSRRTAFEGFPSAIGGWPRRSEHWIHIIHRFRQERM
jgi:hypothetical protein